MKILLTGGSGILGSQILKIYDREYFNIFSPNSKELNILEHPKIKNDFDIIIHCAAMTNTSMAESSAIEAININVLGTINMVNFAAENDSKFVYISTDYVFDGESGGYSTSDCINPISNYSKSKAAGELCSRIYKNSVILRTSFCQNNFPHEKAFEDQWTSRDYVDIIAPIILKYSIEKSPGIYHVGTERKSVFDLASRRKKVGKIKRKDVSSKIYIPKDTSFKY